MSVDRTTPWIKAEISNGSANCVEQRRNGDTIEVRDTKDHGTGPTLRFTPAEFAAWLHGARSGEFDHLL